MKHKVATNDYKAFNWPSGPLTTDFQRVGFLVQLCWKALDFRGKFILLSSLVFIVAISYASSFTPILFADFIDEFSKGAPGRARAFLLLAAFLSVEWLSDVGGETLWITVGPIQQRIQRKINAGFLEYALSLPFQYHVQKSTGEFIEQINQGQNGINQIIWAAITSFFPILFSTIFVLINSYIFLPGSFFLILCIILTVYGAILFYSTEAIRKYQRSAQKDMVEARGFLGDVLLNVESAKIFVQERNVAKRYDDHLASVEQKFGQFLTTRFILGIIQATIVVSGLATALLLHIYGGANNAVSVGSLILVQMYFYRVIGPLQGLSFHYRDMKTALTQLDGVAEILSLEPELDASAGEDRDPAGTTPTSGQTASVNFAQALVFRDVTVLRDGKAIVDSLSLRIEPGQTVALVGATGSGKSSIVRLILKLIEPTSGTIELGDTHLKHISSRVWRDHIGVVPQDIILFNDTLANNLLFANPAASREELEAVIRRSRLERLVESHPQGLGMIVGERGQIISGGERQRIGLARAMLRKPMIYIFDEATSALDRTTEAEILKDFRQWDPAATKILITHRIENIIQADQIFVLEKGSILQSGKHEELMSEGGVYYSFWRDSHAFH